MLHWSFAPVIYQMILFTWLICSPQIKIVIYHDVQMTLYWYFGSIL